MMKRAFILPALMLSLTACTPPPAPPVPPTAPPQTPQMSARRSIQRGQTALSSSVAHAAEAGSGLRVDIYQLQVPFGTISRNFDFWKHIDENAIDVGTYEVLMKNGVRVGQAPVAEWEYFREIMSQYPAITKSASLVAAEAKPVELPVRKELTSQDLFYFDSKNALHGQSFDACENIINVTFQQTPRKPNAMRVTLCPVVRAKQKRLEWSPLNNEMEVNYTAPERLYNLNLRTDVALGSFLIVAPSSESTWRTSIGNNFFITEGSTERMENILLIVPAEMRIEQVPTPAPAPAPVKGATKKK
ncbi:MAG: hypothetical protein QOF78_1881 [Phycisphaerales bacterium]|jgi:hypothetical protein|nr:hypothetical protein [Phycisphaerales bacterium]